MRGLSFVLRTERKVLCLFAACATGQGHLLQSPERDGWGQRLSFMLVNRVRFSSNFFRKNVSKFHVYRDRIYILYPK